MSGVEEIRNFNTSVDMIKFTSIDDINIQLNQLSLIDLKGLESNDIERIKFFNSIYKVIKIGIDAKDISMFNNCLQIISTAITLGSKQINQTIGKEFFTELIINTIWIINDHQLEFALSILNEIIRFENCQVDIIYLDTLLYALEKRNSRSISNFILEILAFLEMQNRLPVQLLSLVKGKEIAGKIMEAPHFLRIKYIILSTPQMNPEHLELMLKVAFRSISDGLLAYDLNSIKESCDIMSYVAKVYPQKLKISKMNLAVQFQCIISNFVNNLREMVTDKEKKECIRYTFMFLDEVLTYDEKLTGSFEIINMSKIKVDNIITSEGMKFLEILITQKSNNVNYLIQTMIGFFNNEQNAEKVVNCQISYFKLLSLIQKTPNYENLKNLDIIPFLELKYRMFEKINTQEVNERLIETFVAFLDMLREVKLNELLEKVLCFQTTPYIVVKAFMMQDKEIIEATLKLTSLPNFPRSKLALAMSSHQIWRDLIQKQPALQLNNCSKMSLTTIKNIDELISELKEKVKDENAIMKESDIITAYNLKINCLQKQVDTACEALRGNENFNAESKHYLLELQEIHEKIQYCNLDVKCKNDVLKEENEKLMREGKVVLDCMMAMKNNYEELRSKNEKLELDNKKLRTDYVVKENKLIELSKKIEEQKSERKNENDEHLNLISRLRKNLDFEKNEAAKSIEQHQKVVVMHSDELKKKDKIIDDLKKKLKDAEALQAKVASLMKRN